MANVRNHNELRRNRGSVDSSPPLLLPSWWYPPLFMGGVYYHRQVRGE